MKQTAEQDGELDVLVVGAGPAGLGMGVALKHTGIERFQILDRGNVCESIANWPMGMQLITPSFPTNSIGMLDLNAIAIGTSPGYSLGAEHPTGSDFASHLRGVAKFFELPTRSCVEVMAVDAKDGRFHLKTSKGDLRARYLIWATGEFQFANIPDFAGAALGVHNSMVVDWASVARGEAGPAVIIGGYESGIDAAFQLSKLGCSSIVLGRESTWASEDSDPSRALSPFTLQRLKTMQRNGSVEAIGNVTVDQIDRKEMGYVIQSTDGRSWATSLQPVLATGFHGGFHQIPKLFDYREDGYPLLTADDESTLTKNLFLAGPSVRHDDLIFCFIYKYRQRFAIVARAIGERLGLDTTELETTYRRWGMFLDDLSCCGEQCVC